MESLLIGGAQSVGKTSLIYRLANRMVSNGYSIVAGNLPEILNDFMVVLEGIDRQNNKTRIIMNSATDIPKTIVKFKDFFDKNGSYHVLISSVRDRGFFPRNDFFRIMELNEADTFEIPLAKITRRGTNRQRAQNWYQERIDLVVQSILSNAPYNI